MNDKTKAVVNGFFSLSEDEKNEFLTEIVKNKELINKGNFSLEEHANVHTINFGPRGQSCPCCNR